MMVPLASLWLPVLVSALAVFVASFVIHTLIGWHNHDFRKLPDEDAVIEALRESGVERGEYLFPCAENPADNMRSDEVKAKWERGPTGTVRIHSAGPTDLGATMRNNLVHWFFYCIVVSLFAGYLGAATLGPGTDYLNVFQVVGTAAFLAYAGAVWQDVIWFAATPANALRAMLDGLIYALLTAGVFGWLWP